ncbi:MAG: hypothetical protein SO000_00535 [Sodaliphilus sp.]|nr:hypothetical protein [Sodaliphilus sp.]
MTKKQYPKGKKLAEMFLDKIKNYPNVQILSQSDVCHIKVDNDEYYLYFKCVTPEGKPHPIEHQRVQLPQRESFETIKESDIPFLFIGYDIDNDVYVCWEPAKVKPRLNKKSYVSFYSRLSIQESVVEGEIRDEELTNGDKFVLFKSADILSFFQMIDQHFVELKKSGQTMANDALNVQKHNNTTAFGNDVVGKLTNINNDHSVKQLVDNMQGCSKLQIMSSCMNEFGEYYPNMSLTDWYKVLNMYLSDLR